MMRRISIGMAIMVLVAPSVRADRPNLIFVLTDDQRYDSLAAHGNDVIETPHLDRLARNAARFTNAHVVMALCSPSRATALTGRYGSRNGVTALSAPLNEGEQTFAQLLKMSGYDTYFSGKWHLGTTPQAAGFENACFFRANGRYWGREVDHDGTMQRPQEHVDLYCVGASIDYLQHAANASNPFVLFHATQLPHMDHTHAWPCSAEFEGRYRSAEMPLPPTWNSPRSGMPPQLEIARNRKQALKYGYDQPSRIRDHIRDYYSVITEMDAILGRLLQEVDNLRLTRNTWIVFASDNGWFLGEHGLTSKVLAYQPSTHVPMMVIGPGVHSGDITPLVTNLDIAPTLLSLAGVEVPQRMQGRSLLPLLRGTHSSADWPAHFVYECIDGYGGTPPAIAAQTARWKLIHTWADKSLIHGAPSFVEIYDLQQDPAESCNLIDGPYDKAVVDRLKEAIGRHLAGNFRR